MKKIRCFLLFFAMILLSCLSVQAAETTADLDLEFLDGVSELSVVSDLSAESDSSDVRSFSSSGSAYGTGVSTRLASSDISESVKQKAIEKIYQCMLNFETTVDLSEYQIPFSSSLAVDLLDSALDKNLYLFNVLAGHTDFSAASDFCSCYTSGDFIYSFEFVYQAPASTLQKEYQTLKKTVTKIRKSLNVTGKPKAQITLAVHDYIALHSDYDTSNKPTRKSYTAYGALCLGKAVCSGYSTAAQLLLQSYGISSKIATSDAMNHAWNLVKLSKKWYHMDITWDDPYPEKKSYVAYWFFLRSDQVMKNHPISKHYAWSASGIKCSSSTYSKIPITDNKTLVHSGSTWYYADKANRIVSLKITGKKMKTFVKLSSRARITSLKIKKNRLTYTYYLNGRKKTASKKL